MKTMGWRFVVVADLGLAKKEPVTVEEALAAAGPEAPRLGLKLLADHAGGAVKIEVVSAAPAETAARLREAVIEPELKSIQDPPLTLIVLDRDFSHQPADLAALTEIGQAAMALQAPVVTGAAPAFFGLKEIKLLPKLTDIADRLRDGGHAAWQRFQKSDEARWVTLTLNRFALRAPKDGEKAEDLPWGRGPWLVAAAVARAAKEQGHPLDISGTRAGLFTGMPTRPYPKLANELVPLATETPVPEQLSQELSRAGFVALTGRMNGDAVTIPLAVNAWRSAPGRLTVSGTLGYQLMAARLAQFTMFLMEEVPPGAEAAAAHLRKAYAEFLGGILGDAPDAVKVTPIQAEGRSIAEVLIRPAARLEGMELQFAFQIPIK
ncbi:MAG TPA: type VI secretion system contractile sheath large subunit [Planctomycetota bacterium]